MALNMAKPLPPVSAAPPRKSRMRGRSKALPSLQGSQGEAGLPPAPGQGFEEEVDRRRLSEDILCEGYVQSFVDFFYLTHRPEPNPDVADADGMTEIQVPPKEMLYVRDNLTAAENARRQGDTGTVYGSYSNLAQHYHSVGDPKTGVYFYEKCLEISRLTNDRRGEMASNHDLGLIYQSMDEAAAAAKYHERHLELAIKDAIPSEEQTAARELVKVYQKIAEEKEAAGDHDSAVLFYQKTLESAQQAAERQSEGLANYRLGRAYVMLGECHRAVQFLEDYEMICKELDDREGEGQACSAMAAAYQALQNDEKALTYLKSSLDIAAETENIAAQGEACCALGVIYNKRAEYDKAVDYFERNFELARTVASTGSVETSHVDVSRVYLGMARGNQMLNQYVNVINHDLRAILSWKTRRNMPGFTSYS